MARRTPILCAAATKPLEVSDLIVPTGKLLFCFVLVLSQKLSVLAAGVLSISPFKQVILMHRV